MKIQKLSIALNRAVASLGLKGRLGMYHIIGQWEPVVGEVIARHARPVSLRGKRLTVQVDSPVWMQQLSLLKPELIEKMNQLMGEGAVTGITLKIGAIEPSGRRQAGTEPLPPLTADEQAAAGRLVEALGDHEIKTALRKLIEKDMRSRKKRK